MNPKTSPLCWRDCYGTGNLLHILWNRGVIRPFWDEVSSLIQEITGHKCTLTPSLALQSLGVEQFPPLTRKVVIRILFATCITLAKGWRSKTSPKIEEVISRMNAQYTVEKLFAYKEGRALGFHKYWDIWRNPSKASSHLWCTIYSTKEW